MISFSSINKQYGKHLLFVDASFQLNPDEKVGLVGPEDSGPGVWNIQSMLCKSRREKMTNRIMPLSVGDTLGPYEILSQIGSGGMGVVY